MPPTNETLQNSIDIAEWIDLRAHLERGGVIVLDRELDLAGTGMLITEDAADIIHEYVAAGQLWKPTEAQIALWDADNRKKFSTLIISPFVLIQEL